MAWYGVNFVLGAGLHSYGFGGGGRGWVLGAVALQLLYATIAVRRVHPRPAMETQSRFEPTRGGAPLAQVE
jgi:hypothetical protein